MSGFGLLEAYARPVPACLVRRGSETVHGSIKECFEAEHRARASAVCWIKPSLSIKS
jgi:hypothetical protein